MRAVVQRVSRARVIVDGEVVGAIGPGLLVLLGVGKEDSQADGDYLVGKIAHLRIFPDQEQKMNRSVKEMGGEVLVVSQFTLYGDCRRGRRPSFIEAAEPEKARDLYIHVLEGLKKEGLRVASGIFQAFMQVELVNDGPVTILLDSKKRF
ncbi:MAG: D-tyrosyl-tRNA(Tyr) deacylase [Nitrospinota bacterium]|nr:MAG: D-tyrosyl-tRNA(Tyr) deacylase [Nitrospinota bacterium]